MPRSVALAITGYDSNSVANAEKLRAEIDPHAPCGCRLPINRDSYTRMTNDQIRRNDEIRRTKPAIAQLGAFGNSGFGFLSSFVIRHLSFVIRHQVHGP